MELEDKSSNGQKKYFTMEEVLADIYARFDLITNTQIRLNTMLQGWYVKLDVYSRVIPKLGEKIGLSNDEFKVLVDTSLAELREEHERAKAEELANKSEETEEALIINPNAN